jgi:hypothetical protein
MNRWLTTMGVNNGGKGYSLVREQSWRLSLCRLTFFSVSEEGRQITNGGFVRNTILRSDPMTRAPSSRSGGSALSSTRHSTARSWSTRSRSGNGDPRPRAPEHGDRHLRLARLPALAVQAPKRVPWPALYGQFGAGFTRLRAFRQHVKEPLALALAAYPEARVEVDDERA